MLDHGYHPERIHKALQQVYPESMTKIQFEVAAKLSKSQKVVQGKSGFVPIAVRWLIEGSNSWVERCKNLVKNEEVDTRTRQNKAQSLLHSLDGEAISYLERCQMRSIKGSGY